MPLEGELTVRVFDFLIGRFLLDSQNLIVVLFPGLFGKFLSILKFWLDTKASLVNFLR